MSYTPGGGTWGVRYEDFLRTVEHHRARLRRDIGFFDGHVLSVRTWQWRDPFGDGVRFEVSSIGLGGDDGSVDCSAATHGRWLAGALTYLDAVESATKRAAEARRRFDQDRDHAANRVLRWRLKGVDADWGSAVAAYRAQVAAAEAAYRPIREAIATCSAALREQWAREATADGPAAAERHRKGAELAAIPLWGLLVTGQGKRTRIIVRRYDVAPAEHLPTDTEPHPWEEREPLTAFTLESALRELHGRQVTVEWEPAARKAVEEECGVSLSAWWRQLFPQSELLRPPAAPRGTAYTGTTRRRGAGGFSSAPAQ